MAKRKSTGFSNHGVKSAGASARVAQKGFSLSMGRVLLNVLKGTWSQAGHLVGIHTVNQTSTQPTLHLLATGAAQMRQRRPRCPFEGPTEIGTLNMPQYAMQALQFPGYHCCGPSLSIMSCSLAHELAARQPKLVVESYITFVGPRTIDGREFPLGVYCIKWFFLLPPAQNSTREAVWGQCMCSKFADFLSIILFYKLAPKPPDV